MFELKEQLKERLKSGSWVENVIVFVLLFCLLIPFFIPFFIPEKEDMYEKEDSYACGYMDGSIATSKRLVAKHNAMYWMGNLDRNKYTNNTCNTKSIVIQY
jgi:hypothetical protein